MIVLKNARIIPELTPGFEGQYADIIIEEEKIAEILPANSANYSQAHVIDIEGKTITPGLIDAHVHVDLCGMNTFEENVQPDTFRVIRALKLAQDNLHKGYTTLRDVGDRNNIVISLAKAIKEGYCVGPDILASGKIVSPTEAGNNFFGDMYHECDSPAECVKAVRQHWQNGADFIKYMGTGAIMNPGGEPGASIITDEELQAIVETADRLNLPVAGHAHGAEGIKSAIKLGVRTVEHSSIMDDECIEMYKNSDKTFMIPTMAPLTHFLEHADQHPKHYVEKSKKLHDVMCEGYKKSYKAGIKMGFGTDAGVYAGGHGDGLYEFKARFKYIGIKPLDCLIQATKNNAEILLIDDLVGTVQVGKKANLVVFDGKPDELIDDLDNVSLVIKDGKIVKA